MFNYGLSIKRLIDIIITVFAIIILLPIIIFLILILSILNEGSPFFIQKRGGYKNCTFKIYKFKTMNDKMDEKGEYLPDYQRLTQFGCIVRNLSLDELPQLFNVLMGDMSIIGPRPLLDTYLPLYSQEQKKDTMLDLESRDGHRLMVEMP